MALLMGAALASLVGGCVSSRERNDLPDCEDGIDNDGDGRIDFPADPGCDRPTDPDEADKPAPLPQCANGIDDDGDGLIDYGHDPGCSAPNDDSEWDKPSHTPACANKIDDDGDGLIDWPNDPGCVDALHDDDETDPPTEPQCHDGIDNDGDGLIDFPLDRKCSSAAWDSEFGSLIGRCGPDDPVTNLTQSGTFDGDFTSAGPSDFVGSCGGNGQEQIFTFTVTATTDLEVSTAFPTTSVPAIVYVRRDCNDATTELSCSAPPAGNNGVTTVLHKATPGTYFILVDTPNNATLGHFTLHVTAYPPLGAKCDPTAMMACGPGAACTSDPLPANGWPYDCRTPADGTNPVSCCAPTACNDGFDNDGDGWTDYPNDPGCASLDGTSELDKCGSPTCASTMEPQCANDVDDDGDGDIDFWNGQNLDQSVKTVPPDLDCESASQDDEQSICTTATVSFAAKPLLTSMPSVTTQAGSQSFFTGSCNASTASFGEAVYVFYVTEAYQSLTFTTDDIATHTFDFFCFPNDTVLYVRTACASTAADLACNDNVSSTDFASTVTLTNPVVGQNLFVFVDHANAASPSAGLDVSGVLADGSACDATSTVFTCPTGDICSAQTSGGPTVCLKPACSDGVDNDGDGFTDYPSDPGCLSAIGNSELDGCGQPTCAATAEPACANDVDDDGDGLIDYWTGQNLDHSTKTVAPDPDCIAASTTSEYPACGTASVGTLRPPRLTDLTAAGTGSFSSTACSASTNSATAGAPDAIYGLYVAAPLDTLTLSTDNAFTDHDTVLYARPGATCDVTTGEVCSDDLASWDPRSQVTLSTVAPGTYWVFADSKTSSTPDFGDFEIDVSGVVSAGGVCDPASTSLVCRSGFTCKATASGVPTTCIAAACADGVDNDGDGWTDYPNDPGCVTPSRDSETDACSPASCTPSAEPACANDVDDDGDGLIDYWPGQNVDHSVKSVGNDPDCLAASGDSEQPECVRGEPLTTIAAGLTAGNSAAGGLVDDFSPSCNRASSSAEQVFHLHVPGNLASLSFAVTASGTYDPDVYVRYGTCSSFDVACAAWPSPTAQPTTLTAGDYYILVDSHTNQTGAFTLKTTGLVQKGQPCDPTQSAFLPCQSSTCTAGICQ
jgi:hypothetical protein